MSNIAIKSPSIMPSSQFDECLGFGVTYVVSAKVLVGDDVSFDVDELATGQFGNLKIVKNSNSMIIKNNQVDDEHIETVHRLLQETVDELINDYY
jgi:hypothetical protein